MKLILGLSRSVIKPDNPPDWANLLNEPWPLDPGGSDDPSEVVGLIARFAGGDKLDPVYSMIRDAVEVYIP